MPSWRCHADGCETKTRYFMCGPHWRLVPPEIKRVWRAQLLEERTPEWRVALWENVAEIRRIVSSIEKGTQA